MGLVILFVCLGAALNLALGAALWRSVAGLPAAFLALARRERAEGEARALTVLEEMAARRVGAITSSLQALEEQQIERNRNEIAAAEVRARVAERRATDTAPVLAAASELVRELRRTLDELGRTLEGLGGLLAVVQVASDMAHAAPATPMPDSGARKVAGEGGAQAAARETVPAGPASDRRTLETAPPPGCALSPIPPGEEDDDDCTLVATRPAIRPPPQLDDAGSGEGRPGRPGDQPEGRAP
jgi:hypothetical protein